MENKIEIYKTSKGTDIHATLEDETVWLSQMQMAELFGKMYEPLMSMLRTFTRRRNYWKIQLSGNPG